MVSPLLPSSPYARKLDWPTARRLGAKHELDPRTIMKEHREAGSVRGMAGARARAALAELETSGA